ncbi:MAG: ThiF family adenylyltransferase [Deltaproteobacteria bacterium]|nr:ThiF family adenylyltransferase [Deltaproteobacteria bacterium]
MTVDGVALDQGAVCNASALVPQAGLAGLFAALGLQLAGLRRVYLLGPTLGPGPLWMLGRAERLRPGALSHYPDLRTAAQLAAVSGVAPDQTLAPEAPGHGAASALVAAGMAVDRALFLAGLPGVALPTTPMEAPSRGLAGPLRLFLVGAGSAGTAFLVGLLAARWQLEIGELTVHLVDHDAVEPRNLNRCMVWDQGHLGSLKVHAVASTLATIAVGSGLRLTVGAERFDPEAASAFAPDVVVSAVDNYRARAEINAWATRNGKPLIEFGCSPFTARAEVCVPWRSACLRERLRVDELAQDEAREASGGCGRRADGAVVGSNMVAAGLGLWGLFALLRGDPPRGALLYDLLQGTRGVARPKAVCLCWEKG